MLRYHGVNPVVDLVLVRSHPQDGLQVLLIQRSHTSEAEPSKWALPGGFVNTTASVDESFDSGDTEPPLSAALRECEEETGLDVKTMHPYVKHVGVYTGPGRDPREDSERFTQSHAFLLSLDGLMPHTKSDKIAGCDDAIDAKWIGWRELRSVPLAFDHSHILCDAERFLVKDFWVLSSISKPPRHVKKP